MSRGAEPLNPVEQVQRKDRLLQELKLVALKTGVAYEDPVAPLSGKQKNATFRENRTDFNCSLNPIDFGHVHVTDVDFRTPAPGLLHSVSAAIHGNSVVSILIEDHGEGISDNPLVIGYQNPW
jgi:hypothetical protein